MDIASIMKSSGMLLLLFVCACLIATPAFAQQQPDDPTASSLSCIQCHSRDNETCAESGDAEKLSQFSVKCNWAKMKAQLRERYGYDFNYDPEHVRCRKTTQNVESEPPIIVRECAHLFPEKAEQLSEPDSDTYYCRYRAGTYHVNVHVCYCNEDDCNGAPTIRSTSVLLLLGAVCWSLRQ